VVSKIPTRLKALSAGADGAHKTFFRGYIVAQICCPYSVPVMTSPTSHRINAAGDQGGSRHAGDAGGGLVSG